MQVTMWQQDAEFELPGTDPEKCAQIIYGLAKCENPPREIVLGTFAYDVLKETTADRLNWAEQWKGQTVGADE